MDLEEEQIQLMSEPCLVFIKVSSSFEIPSGIFESW